MNDTVLKDDRPDVRGMIAKVRHLVRVEEVEEVDEGAGETRS
jgi:large subunit ribosomal protein L30